MLQKGWVQNWAAFGSVCPLQHLQAHLPSHLQPMPSRHTTGTPLSNKTPALRSEVGRQDKISGSHAGWDKTARQTAMVPLGRACKEGLYAMCTMT